eukprot:9130303-Ditylum_brightwellii.AAC.1
MENTDQPVVTVDSCHHHQLLATTGKMTKQPIQNGITDNILEINEKKTVPEERYIPSFDHTLLPCFNAEGVDTNRFLLKENVQPKDITDSVSCHVTLPINKTLPKPSKKSQPKASSKSHQQRRRKDRRVSSTEGNPQAKDMPHFQAKSLLAPSTSNASLRALFAAEA